MVAVIRYVYVAGSSAELERCEAAMAQLRAVGIYVTSTWTESVRSVGSANPRDATAEQRRAWSVACLSQLMSADMLWFLVPSVDKPTRGAWFELATAIERCQRTIVSGDSGQSIFSALADAEYASDDEALARILHLAGISTTKAAP